MKERMLTTDEITAFQRQIYGHYKLHGRDLPWRHTTNPYNIVVSEMMLQQTQVERVKEKYREFILAFPDFQVLARASLKEVLAVWQGLGYNRRALALKQLAETVVSDYGGELPKDPEELCKLPGIGRTTAGEILAFAFNIPGVFIETNIRRVFIYEFFNGEENVKDARLLPLVETTLDRKNPREWYWALMDYGSMLKKKVDNPNRRSAHYVKQPPFTGSDRKIRGLILKILLEEPIALTRDELNKRIGSEPDRIKSILTTMAGEGLIREEQGVYLVG